MYRDAFFRNAIRVPLQKTLSTLQTPKAQADRQKVLKAIRTMKVELGDIKVAVRSDGRPYVCLHFAEGLTPEAMWAEHLSIAVHVLQGASWMGRMHFFCPVHKILWFAPRPDGTSESMARYALQKRYTVFKVQLGVYQPYEYETFYL